jgi:uncharacterized protein (DUF433 family)
MSRTIETPVEFNRIDADSDTELVPKTDPRSEIISIDPERMWGTPCFVGTRLPLKTLFDYLEAGASLDEFLEDFDGISRELCVNALRMAYERLMEGLPSGTGLP